MTILSNAHVVSNPNPIPLRFVPGPVRPGWVRQRYLVVDWAGPKSVYITRADGDRSGPTAWVAAKYILPESTDGDFATFEFPEWLNQKVQRAIGGGPHDAA